MKKIVIAAVLALALAVVGVAAAAVAKASYSYRATLTVRQEVPAPKGAPAKAGGTFTATVTENGAKRSIKWKLTFHNLSGKAVAAHIHMGKPGVAGGVILALCGPCTSGMTGNTATTTDVGDALEHGKAYVNVHTAKNAGGEIRGAVKLTGHS
jgi:CHRD domain